MNSSFRKRMRALFATNILALSALVCSFPTLIAPAVADESLFLPVCAEQGESLLTVQRAASNPYDDKPRDNRAWQVEVRQVSTDTDLIRGKNQDPTYWQNWLRKQNNNLASLPLAAAGKLTGENLSFPNLPIGIYVVSASSDSSLHRLVRPSLVSIPNFDTVRGCWSNSSVVALKTISDQPPAPPDMPPPVPPSPNIPPLERLVQTGAPIIGAVFLSLGLLSFGVMILRRRKRQDPSSCA